MPKIQHLFSPQCKFVALLFGVPFYSIRLNIEGFFWVPRELMGDEEQMYAFYDEPEMLHDMAEYICKVYETKLMRVVKMLQPDVIYIMEDLSGKNGPMISGEFFDAFIGAYYRRLIPQSPNHKLNTLCDYFGLELDHHHAGSDSRADKAMPLACVPEHRERNRENEAKTYNYGKQSSFDDSRWLGKRPS